MWVFSEWAWEGWLIKWLWMSVIAPWVSSSSQHSTESDFVHWILPYLSCTRIIFKVYNQFRSINRIIVKSFLYFEFLLYEKKRTIDSRRPLIPLLLLLSNHILPTSAELTDSVYCTGRVCRSTVRHTTTISGSIRSHVRSVHRSIDVPQLGQPVRLFDKCPFLFLKPEGQDSTR